MSTILLHPTAMNLRNVLALEARTGLRAEVRGLLRVELCPPTAPAHPGTVHTDGRYCYRERALALPARSPDDQPTPPSAA